MNPAIQIKPVFVGWIAFVVQIPLQLFFTVWAGGFFGGILSGITAGDASIGFIIGLAVFIAIPVMCWVGKKYNYENTVYKIFDDRVEFEEGFLTVQQKTVHFRDIREITLRKGILQRSCDLGSVYLATQATGSSHGNPFSMLGMTSASASGLTIRDVTNADDLYQKLRALIRPPS